MYQNDETSDVERQSVGKDLWVLADAIAYRKTFRTELRKRLMVQARVLDAEKEVRTLGTTSQDKGEARSPSWLQRLAQGVGRIRQIFQARGGLTMKKGFALAAIAALIIAVSMVAFVPSARAWAQSVLTKFGAWIITDAPTLAEVPRDTTKATPIGLPTSTPFAGLQPIQPTPLPILPVEEASDVAGFQVLFPEYVPAGYRLVSRAVYTPEVGVLVFTTWATESGEEHMGINQMRYVPGYELEFPVGNAPTVDVTVRGQPGLWAEGAKLGSRGEEIVAINVLIWEEEDDLFRLTSDELTLAEMLKIAESLKMAVALREGLPERKMAFSDQVDQAVPFIYAHGGTLKERDDYTLTDPRTVEAVRWFVDLASIHDVMSFPEQLELYEPEEGGGTTVITTGGGGRAGRGGAALGDDRRQSRDCRSRGRRCPLGRLAV